MFTIRRGPNDRCLELGGGERPMLRPACQGGQDICVDVRTCFDADGRQTTDFTADFNEPLPIGSDEFDGVLTRYCIEHLSYPKVPQFVAEMFRVLKPGGRVVVVAPDTEAQLEWARRNPDGWDGKDAFTSASELLFGTQDYAENTHRAYFSKPIIEGLLLAAGFREVRVTPFGERGTDLIAQAVKPASADPPQPDAAPAAREHDQEAPAQPSAAPATPAQSPEHAEVARRMAEESSFRAAVFGKDYWHGGQLYGGYAREGYWDYPVHWVTAEHVKLRRPRSVVEIGAARGYLVKKLNDAGIPAFGLEISRHCYMTRVTDRLTPVDLCDEEAVSGSGHGDLALSVAVLEHIPEKHLPGLLRALGRISERGLHGVDFGHGDDGFDKTHCNLRDRAWWRAKFDEFGLQSHEVVDKEELERGPLPLAAAQGDGKVKLNVGSFTTMHLHGWVNVDAHDLGGFAQRYGYRFAQVDVRSGLPWATGTVDLMNCQHVLEHLTYAEGLAFLRDARRAARSGCVLRIVVPDLAKLSCRYLSGEMAALDEINDPSAASPTNAGKFWNMLVAGHQAAYDREALGWAAQESGWQVHHTLPFTTLSGPAGEQILRETLDMQPEISRFAELVA